VLRLLAFVLPLGAHSFAVAAALGAAGLTSATERLRVSAIFVAFEAGMPLIGLAAGGGIARVIGNTADYVAVAAVIGLGSYMLLQEMRTPKSRGPAGRGRRAHLSSQFHMIHCNTPFSRQSASRQAAHRQSHSVTRLTAWDSAE
jgi:putative Mn2+ efflux pump MntP